MDLRENSPIKKLMLKTSVILGVRTALLLFGIPPLDFQQIGICELLLEGVVN